MKYPKFPVNQLYRYFHKQGIQIRGNEFTAKKYFCNDDYFNVIDTEEKAYWLGFIAADGYISKKDNGCDVVGIALVSTDKNHLEKFSKAVEFTGDIKTYSAGVSDYSSNDYCRIIITSKNMSADLRKHGIKYNKSLIMNFDDLDFSKEWTSCFVRGYFDGNGCITYSMHPKYHDRRYAIKICGTKSMLRGIEQCFSNKQRALYQRNKNDKDNF